MKHPYEFRDEPVRFAVSNDEIARAATEWLVSAQAEQNRRGVHDIADVHAGDIADELSEIAAPGWWRSQHGGDTDSWGEALEDVADSALTSFSRRYHSGDADLMAWIDSAARGKDARGA